MAVFGLNLSQAGNHKRTATWDKSVRSNLSPLETRSWGGGIQMHTTPEVMDLDMGSRFQIEDKQVNSKLLNH